MNAREQIRKELDTAVQWLPCGVSNDRAIEMAAERVIAAKDAEIERLTERLSIMTENRDMWLRRSNENMVRAEAAENRY